MPQHPFPSAETIQQTPKAVHDGAGGHGEQIGRCPPCHTPLPHAITPHYPVSMNPTRKLPPVHLLTRHSRPDRESRGWDKGRASSRRKPSHPYGFRICFSYLQKSGSRLALQLDITSETIRRKTAPTGTIYMALAASSTPPMSRFSRLLLSPATGVPLNHHYDSCTISPQPWSFSASSAFRPLAATPAWFPACAGKTIWGAGKDGGRAGRTGNRSSLSI